MAELFQLWAFAPGESAHTVLPQPLKWVAGFALSDSSALQLTYPVDATGIDMLDRDFCDVEVRYWNGSKWVCPPQGRFLKVNSRPNIVDEQGHPSRQFTLPSYSWLLRRVMQAKTTDLDDQDNRVFANKSPGQVVGVLISEAKSAGAVPDLTYQNSSGTGGSSPSVPFGKSVFDYLATARDQGQLEWLMVADGSGQGRKLRTYSSVGTDLSNGANPVAIRYDDRGSLVDAPSQVSAEDLAGRALVAGDNGHLLNITNPSAQMPYGLLMDYVTASGISDAAALEIVAQARLDKGAGVRAQHTRQIRFVDGGPKPFVDYGLGDTVLGPDATGSMVSLRLRQITITFDEDGLGGNLTLGDRFTEREIAMQRRVSQLSGGAGAIAGSGSKPTSSGDDKRRPKAPTGFNVGSVPYTDPEGVYRALGNFGWVLPTEATDGTDMNPGSVELWGRKGTSGTFALITTADYPATSVQWSPFDAGDTWQFKVRAVSTNGKTGPFSGVVQHTMAEDTEGPNKPSKGWAESRLGTVRVNYDGLDENGNVQPADYDFTAAFMSSGPGFTPSDATRIGIMHGRDFVVITGLPYNVNRYVKLVSYDNAGNASEPSDPLTVVSKPLVDTDMIGQVIAGAHIVDGSITASDKIIGNTITAGLLQAEAVTAGKIAANAVTADAIRAGAVKADKIEAGAVTAEKLTVGAEFNALCPSLAIEPDTWSLSNASIGNWAFATDGKYVRFNDSATAFSQAAGPRRQTAPGDVWRLGAWVALSGGSTQNVFISAYWFKGDGSANGTSFVDSTNQSGAGQLDGTVTAPAGAVMVRFVINGTTTSSTGWASIANMTGVRQADSTRIADGAITTDKIHANSVSVGKLDGTVITDGFVKTSLLKADDIRTKLLDAQKITAGDLLVSGSINASLITSGADFVNLAPDLATNPDAWSLEGDTVIQNNPTAGSARQIQFNVNGRARGPLRPCTPGNVFYAEATAYSDGTSTNPVSLVLYWFDEDQGYIGSAINAAHSGNGGVEKLSGTATAPANAYFVRLAVTRLSTPASGRNTVNSMSGYLQAGYTRIEDNAITADKINVTSLSAISANLGSLVVGTSNLADEAVTWRQIAQGTVDTGRLHDSAVNEVKIANGAVTATKISVNQLSAITADMGELTSGKITSAIVRSNDNPSAGGWQLDETGLRFWAGTNDRRAFFQSNGTIELTGEIHATSGDFTGTVSASNFVGTNNVTGTMSGGTYSSPQFSGGSGYINGPLYASGSGSFQSTNGTPKVQIAGSAVGFIENTTQAGSSISQTGGRLWIYTNGGCQVSGGILTADEGINSPGVWNNTYSGTSNVFVGSSGNLRRATSSIRGKAAIRPFTDYRKILDAQPVTWIDRNEKDGTRFVGFTAEGLAKAGLTHLVALGPDGRPSSVNYDRITAYTVPIIRDHDRRLDAIEQRLTALESAKGAA